MCNIQDIQKRINSMEELTQLLPQSQEHEKIHGWEEHPSVKETRDLIMKYCVWTLYGS